MKQQHFPWWSGWIPFRQDCLDDSFLDGGRDFNSSIRTEAVTDFIGSMDGRRCLLRAVLSVGIQVRAARHRRCPILITRPFVWSCGRHVRRCRPEIVVKRLDLGFGFSFA